MKTYRNRNLGFTLVEMAIVLVIVGLLLGGLLMPLSAQMDQRKNSETQKALDEINQALIGFAVANGRLPCPTAGTIATGQLNAGIEATQTVTTSPWDSTNPLITCSSFSGVIPWNTLGISELDAWGNRISYSVRSIYAHGLYVDPNTLPIIQADKDSRTQQLTGCANPISPSFPTQSSFALCSPGTVATTIDSSSVSDIQVLTAYTGGNTIATKIPAIIISHGKNGYGAYTSNGGQLPLPPNPGDEYENTNGNFNFVSHTPTATFDDLVTWLSPNILFNRMVAAGKLP